MSADFENRRVICVSLMHTERVPNSLSRADIKGSKWKPRAKGCIEQKNKFLDYSELNWF